MKQLKLIDVIKNDSGTLKGFFDALVNLSYGNTQDKWYEKFAWSDEVVTNLISSTTGVYDDLSFLDEDFLYNHSGELLISPYLEKQLDNDGLMATTTQWTSILKNVLIKYGNKWDRLYALLKAQYDPIQNYNMIEKETLPTKTTKANTLVTTHNEENADVDSNEDVYGFNSVTPVPLNSNNVSKDKLNNYQDGSTTGLADDNYVEESYDTFRELTREGNIGVTTTSQLIEGEINLWQWNFIQNVVYKDLDELLTLNIYGE